MCIAWFHRNQSNLRIGLTQVEDCELSKGFVKYINLASVRRNVWLDTCMWNNGAENTQWLGAACACVGTSSKSPAQLSMACSDARLKEGDYWAYRNGPCYRTAGLVVDLVQRYFRVNS